MNKNSKPYRELKQELEELLAWFENADDVDIDQARDKYIEAERVLAELEQYLQAVKDSVEAQTKKGK